MDLLLDLAIIIGGVYAVMVCDKKFHGWKSRHRILFGLLINSAFLVSFFIKNPPNEEQIILWLLALIIFAFLLLKKAEKDLKNNLKDNVLNCVYKRNNVKDAVGLVAVGLVLVLAIFAFAYFTEILKFLLTPLLLASEVYLLYMYFRILVVEKKLGKDVIEQWREVPAA